MSVAREDRALEWIGGAVRMGEAADREVSPLQPGEIVAGRYQIQRLLGRGGFAYVFEGLDLKIDQSIAIKVLRELEDDSLRTSVEARFLREARIGASLAHPDVARIYDFDRHQGRHPYLIMERLEGHSLAYELWNRGPMELRRAYHLMTHALHGLAHVHDRGIIHRDLKPGNLFLVYPDEFVERLKILDFGIAFFFDEARSRLTETGGFVGTPPYGAPEYMEHRLVTPALDVYQAGLVFLEMVTGELPSGDAAQSVEAAAALAGSPLRSVLERALARDVEARYANARVFLEAMLSVDSLGDTLVFAPEPTTQNFAPISIETTMHTPPDVADPETLLFEPNRAERAPLDPSRPASQSATPQRRSVASWIAAAAAAIAVAAGAAWAVTSAPTQAPNIASDPVESEPPRTERARTATPPSVSSAVTPSQPPAPIERAEARPAVERDAEPRSDPPAEAPRAAREPAGQRAAARPRRDTQKKEPAKRRGRDKSTSKKSGAEAKDPLAVELELLREGRR